jgi:hypothetical protein
MYSAAAAPDPPLPADSGAGSARHIDGPWPRHWTAPRHGGYVAWLDYSNRHGPINTGITAAVRRLEIRCAGSPRRLLPVVMPHSTGWQASTTVRFEAAAGAACTFSLLPGFNMSDLAQFAHYTASPLPPPLPPAKAGMGREIAAKPARARLPPNGGMTGPLNRARIGALRIAPLAAAGKRR